MIAQDIVIRPIITEKSMSGVLNKVYTLSLIHISMCKTLEAGHSRHRIVHHKDSTGKAIVDALIEVVKTRKNITMLDLSLIHI